MSKHRFTMEELETHSDKWVLFKVVQDRQSDVTNPYTPFAQRLEKIKDRLWAELRQEGEI